jgi:hypothetical protein
MKKSMIILGLGIAIFAFWAWQSEASAAAVELYSTPLYNDANLVSYWRFENSLSDTKNVNNLTNENSANSTSGKFGDARAFVKSSAQSASKASGSSLPSNVFSVSVWIYLESVGNYYNMAVSIGSDTGNPRGGIYLIAWNPSVNGGNAIVELGSNYAHINTTDTSTTGVWYHFVSTFDGTNHHLWVNGVEQGTGVSQGNGEIETTGGIYVGRFAGSQFYFEWRVDDLAIFSRVLTTDEVSDIYTGDWPGGGGEPVQATSTPDQVQKNTFHGIFLFITTFAGMLYTIKTH